MRNSTSWRRIATTLARTTLPCHCAICGMASPDLVCPPCVTDYVKNTRRRCTACANPMDLAGSLCARCLAHTPSFDATIAATDYAPPLDRLVLRLKFAAALPLAGWFATMLHEAIMADTSFIVPDLLCPVPLGDGRLTSRGFNQALEIARPLARTLGIALHPALALRVTETRAQSSVAPAGRARNVHNAFALSPPAIWLVRGKHVGVVDDVMTSGHTLGELAALFKRSGAARVSNLVFARTPPS
ncbi:ComF family protein [Pseudoduganella sp. GCM10020061]|uniref:ComF family protein n=1 Tax=Pseudoduganella sp. GCM10020061 TaxID=3317345 RepID=UPI003627CC55